MSLQNKTVLISGGSRGIGKAIALRLAGEGANLAIASKTTEAHPRLEGTIFSAAEEIEKLGVKVLPIACDVRHEDQVEAAIRTTADTFGGIDILINNASAISLTPTEHTDPKRYDLMQDIQVRGSFLMCRAALPYLRRSEHAHILHLSPPINLQPKWLGQHLAYTISKYGMSMIVMGLAEELKGSRISVNALWPQTTIATAAVQNLLGGDRLMQMSRVPRIVADAAYYILRRPAGELTGQFFIDEEVLKNEGIQDLNAYAVQPGGPLMRDIFLDE